MSIFDFLFARSTTPEQRNKSIFLDAIDGGGRFASFRDVADDDPNKFRGGPLGISALLNALGVDPYGSTDAQPPSPPTRTAPVARPAQQSAPRPAATPNLVDFITANNNLGLRPSTNAELTEAFGYTNPTGETALNLLAPQIDLEVFNPLPPAPGSAITAQVEAALRDTEPDYYRVALRNPDFLPWLNKNYPGYLESIRANTVTAAVKELVARQFMALPANPRNQTPIITQEPSPPVN